MYIRDFEAVQKTRCRVLSVYKLFLNLIIQFSSFFQQYLILKLKERAQ